MSPIGDGGWRIRYLGPWTWHTHGDRDGWAFPQRQWGWRLVVTARGQRLDLHGTGLDALLDALEAALHFPNRKPVDQCDRCLPGLEDGERIPIYLPGDTPCEHVRADACGCGNGNRPGLHIEGGGMCHLKGRSDR